jgi:hypothetical protein
LDADDLSLEVEEADVTRVLAPFASILMAEHCEHCMHAEPEKIHKFLCPLHKLL